MMIPNENTPSRQTQIDQLERQQIITQQKIARLQESYQATQARIDTLRMSADELP